MKRAAIALFAVAAIGTIACSRGNVGTNGNTDASTNGDADAMRAPAVGFASVKGDRIERPTDADTPFEAASIAKTIVGTSVMQLVESGALDLDAPVSKWVSFVTRPITLRMLLTHTSGLVDGTLLETRATSLESVVRSHLVFSDGGSAYSNVGFALAALVVERASGQDFPAYTSEHIFAPLGMTHTTWTPPSDLAMPSRWSNDHFITLAPPSHAVYPAVDLFSTARDLASFARAILLGGGGILKPATVRQMLDESLGWQTSVLASRVFVGHEGEDEGASTAIVLDRKTRRAAVVLANGDVFHSGDKQRIEAFQSLLLALL